MTELHMPHLKQPLTVDISKWGFTRELSQPIVRRPGWFRQTAASGEVSLSGGVSIKRNFPDSGNLDTAYNDLEQFFEQTGIPLDGQYRIITEKDANGIPESYRIDISHNTCRILAGDPEGIRRGIYYLEDLLLSSDGPFLKREIIRRSPWLRTRISRCFFGPIKRPPLNRDELLDEVDYYPEEYLNRLAYEAVNGLWLTVEFKDLCKTSILELDKNAEKRLDKLRRTVEKCLRYGIKIYILGIEPCSIPPDGQVLSSYPELKGALDWNGNHCFCPFSEIARKHLYESVNWIFSRVPGLGGMINISLGERATTCLSVHSRTSCPVCSRKFPGEIIAAALTPMERGIHDAAPKAELISWLYVPDNGTGNREDREILDIAGQLPENVILQYNFESSGGKVQQGKYRHAGDYWLSYTGPSPIFLETARSARKNRNAVSAKIQAGCSHEVATVPFIPAPVLLYGKYGKMKEAEVSHVMQCWYFGNYPGIMNKTAGELAFENFDRPENDFILHLARLDWGCHAEKVTGAWNLLADAYANYPLDNMFQYYGPMHDGIVWPLYLVPENKPLAPTWKLEYGISGDRYGECLGKFSLDDVLSLTEKMSRGWNRGTRIFCSLRPMFTDNPERMKDIGLVEALNIQFESGYNIIKFYALRNILLDNSNTQSQWYSALDEMKSITKSEIQRSGRMIELCKQDSRLGFHPEAEGYKYSPEKLITRLESLRKLLQIDFPATVARLRTGKTPLPPKKRKSYLCNSGKIENVGSFSWKADYNGQKLKIKVYNSNNGKPDFSVRILLEEKPFHPPEDLTLESGGYVEIQVCPKTEKVGFNIIRIDKDKHQEQQYTGWQKFSPLKYRLRLGDYNPAAMGELVLGGTGKNQHVRPANETMVMEAVN